MLSVFAESTVAAVVALLELLDELLPQPAKTTVAAMHMQRRAQMMVFFFILIIISSVFYDVIIA